MKMKHFLETSNKSLHIDNDYVREFITYQLSEFPHTPPETVNKLLRKALKSKYEHKISLLGDLNYRKVNEESLPMLLQLFKTTPKDKWHLIERIVLHLPASVVIENRQLLNKYMNQSFFELCQICQSDNVDMLKNHLNRLIKKLEKEYKQTDFDYAKKIHDRLIELNYYDASMIKKKLDKEKNKDWFSYDGIFAVRAVGILRLPEFIQQLASLLDSDDDLLLEELANTLNYFQTNDVVTAVEPYAKDIDTNFFAIEVLRQTKTTLSEDILVDCYDRLEVVGKEVALAGLISQYSEKAIPLIEDYIKNEYRAGILDMNEKFYGFYHVINQSHPLLEEWKKQIQATKEHYKKLSFESLAKFGLKPIKVEKVGRNDPCPCGSGKKYKKCCGA